MIAHETQPVFETEHIQNQCIDVDYHPEQPEREDGVYMDELADGAVLELVTQRHHYLLIKRSGSQVQIFGHPVFCMEPTLVEIIGSVPERPITSPKPGFIGCGMYLMFRHPVFDKVTTSRITEIHTM